MKPCQSGISLKKTLLFCCLAVILALLVNENAGRRTEYGLASWYVTQEAEWTCASWDYPIGALLNITNLSNGKQVVCRVLERGPDRALGRAVDLSRTAFNQIADEREGVLRVRVSRVL